MKLIRPLRHHAARIEPLEARIAPASFVVTTIADTGAGSLRQAILDANAAPNGGGPDVISFNIASGPFVIQPLTPLPVISEAVIIDGYTQPGATANTLAIGNDAVLLIELSGASAGAGVDGLSINADGSTIRGLVINRWGGEALKLSGAGPHVVEGNFIGTNAAGTAAAANGGSGIEVRSAAAMIGGASPAARNVISGNIEPGVLLGVEAAGTIVRGNYLGTDAAGATAVGNGEAGISMASANSFIGGTAAGAGNLISGNIGPGILIQDPTVGPLAAGNVIQGNRIGTRADGATALGNVGVGVRFFSLSSTTTIGGAGGGNTIAFNAGGIQLQFGNGVRITHNSIFANAGLGIDIDADGVTANDSFDGDTGTNDVLNFPVLATAVRAGATTTVTGSFSGAASTTLTLDFYASPAADASGFGEGQTYLGSTSITTNAAGMATFDFAPGIAAAPGSVITATATDALGDTSEFSAALAQAETFTWDGGGGDTNWENQLNWDLDLSFPGAEDSAVLDIASTIDTTGDRMVRNFTQTAGTLTGADTLIVRDNFIWTSGTQTGGGATILAAGSYSPIFGGASPVLDNRTLEIAGTLITSASDSLQFRDAASVVVSGAFHIAHGVAFDDLGGLQSSVEVTPTGELRVRDGLAILFEMPLRNEGRFTVGGAGTSVMFASGLVQNGGTTTLLGGELDVSASAADFLGGELRGYGTITGNLNNSGAIVRPGGDTPGTFLPANVNVSGLTGANGFRISGAAANTQSGYSVGAAGDVNGDGFDDVIIGAIFAGASNEGAAYVVFGNGTPFPADLSLAALTGANGFKISGEATSDFAGGAVSGAGDVNGDGIDDLIVGAVGATTTGIRAGAAYVIFGSTTPFAANVNLSALTGTNGFKISGEAASDAAGGAVSAAGDVNGDGFADVIIGAYQADSGGSGSGAGYVVFGGAAPFAANLLLSALTGADGFRMSGAAVGERAGRAVSKAGDVNADGIDDVIIGAFGAQPNGFQSGASYVVFGSRAGFAADLNLSTLTGANGFKLSGEAANDNAGQAVGGGGDINGDGIDDILVGAPFDDDGASNAGASYVIFGRRAAFPANTQLSGLTGANGFKITGVEVNGIAGIAVSIAGDLNGDGIDDVLIGEQNADAGAFDSGASYIVFGRTGGFAATLSVAALSGADGFKISGAAASGLLGGAVSAAGDLNGDGVADLLVGARRVAANGNFSGASYVIFGSSGIGALTITGDYTQGSGARLDLQLAGAGAVEFDRLSVSGTAMLGGALRAKLVGGFAPPTGTFDLVNAATRSGTFASEDLPPGFASNYTATAAQIILGGGGSPLVVTTTLDVINAGDGVTSLREAIIFANGNAGPDTITFSIPGAGVQTIAPTSALPAITDAIVIDGYTQPGANANTLASGSDAVLLIELAGSAAPGAAGFNITSGGSTIRGLILNGFGGDAIVLSGAGGNVIAGNFIGTNAAGTAAGSSNFRGVFVAGSSSNTIGGASPGDRNLFAGHQHVSVDIAFGAANNIVQGNFFGTDKTGTVAITNFLTTILVNGSPGNLIGGALPGAGNLFANTVGVGQAIVMAGSSASTGTVVQGNTIGTDITRTLSLGFDTGIAVSDGATGNLIGGDLPGEGNFVANCVNEAVLIATGSGSTIRGNTLINSGILIDLGGNGPTANDPGDTDGGANGLQNFPVLTGAAVIGSDLGIAGSLDSVPGNYTIELYRGLFSQGGGAPFATFSITIGATGVFSRMINSVHVPPGEFISAIATNDTTGDTSEFGAVVLAALATPEVVAPKDPFTFTDADGETVRVSFTGRGSLNVLLQGGVPDNADIFSIELIGTDLGSNLSVAITSKDSGGTTIARIFTTATQQHMGEVIFRGDITLGNGVADSAPDLLISGKTNKLSLGDLAANTFIKLGQDLPYDEPGNKVPDTRNNEPTLSVGDVLGAGVNIEVLGDGTPAGIGGGGFQSVTFNSWAFDGFLRTTQGIGKFLIKTGDFFGVLEVDKFRNGEQTTANVGSMIVAEGAWGSSGSEIEGNIGSFDVQAFAFGATITAGSMGRVKSAGELAGTFILTDPDAGGVPTFTVNSDFSARIISAVSIKKLKIKGDFTGSLEAPSIGSISAFSFLGTMGATEIVANAGKLGTLKSTTGVFRDYAIVTDEAFSGISVKARKLGADTVGIENVSITAASIGKITVDLAADSRSAGVSLTGIRDSEFITTATGTAKGTQGSIANVTVKLKGGAGGDGTGMENVTLDARVLAGEFGAGTPASTANPLGNLSVKVSGFGGASAGIVNGDFHGDTIGKTSVSVTRGGSGTARGVDGVIYTATGAIGAMKFGGDVTQNMIANLQVLAGGKLAGLNVAAKDSALGSIVDSAILAGQSLALTGGEKEQKAALSAASLGAVKIAGSLIGTQLVAGANIGGVSIGGTATDSLILAGAMLGGDFTLGDGNETFQRAAAVSGVTVKGAFTRSSIVAGIASTNATFGDADDVLAAVAGTLAQSSSIGAVKLGSGSGTNATGPAIAHDFAIQAAAIKSLANDGSTVVKDFATALFLNAGTAGEDADDVLVRVIP